MVHLLICIIIAHFMCFCITHTKQIYNRQMLCILAETITSFLLLFAYSNGQEGTSEVWSHREVKPLNHRFHSLFVSLVCAVLIICTAIGIGQLQPSDRTDTTALSFSVSSQLLEQLDTNIHLHIQGLLPAQETTSSQTHPIMLYPGGQPVGILLRTDGILVVGYSPVQNGQDELYPAQNAGIQAGDLIIGINGTTITHDDELAMLVNQYGAQGEEITLDVKRQNRTLSKTITPVFCQQTDTYRIGLFIRDNAGGVGTLTFVNPETMQYGALGHMIANNETQRKLNILNGKLVAANIQGIKKGTAGSPGEKIGRFVNNDPLGSIEQNTEAGIFGTLSDRKFLTQTIASSPLPTASSKEIHTGSAVIYTALDGNKVRSYTIEIEKVNHSSRDDKNMVLRITDPELLHCTGGIIQGMSGSPIIQDGKLIGAVTHVFINDPTRGYGIFIENMLHAAG